jgi:branched-chain amino acid transport system ATP-binding protein
MLRCEGVSVAYGALVAVNDIDLRVDAGSTVGIIGPNGAGKTSFLRGVCGLERVRGGSVHLDGVNVTGLPAAEFVRRGVSMVPAGRQLFPNLTVHRNLWLGAYVHSGSAAGRRKGMERLEHVLELFPVLHDRRRQAAGSLSGGEQQMLAISRALMADPRLVVLDEPSLGLAPMVLAQIFDALRLLVSETGIAVLLVEQNAELTAEFVDQVYLFDSGRVVKSGSVSDLTSDDIGRAYFGG